MDRIMSSRGSEVRKERFTISSVLSDRIDQEVCITSAGVEIFGEFTQLFTVHRILGEGLNRHLKSRHVTPMAGSCLEHAE